MSAEEARGLAGWCAAGLKARGAVAGDRIAITSPEAGPDRAANADLQVQILALVLGALGTGIIPVMINPMLTAREQQRIITDSGALFSFETMMDIGELFGDGSMTRMPDVSDVPLGRPMHYTSGTTGVSKGVWSGVLDYGQASRLWGDEQEQWGFGPDDVTLVHGPLAHSGPLRFALMVLLAGGSVILPGGFDASEIAALIQTEKPTTAFTVPSHLQRLFALRGGPPPSPYRMLTHAGAACPASLKNQIHDWAGIERTWEFYGSTEGQFAACHGPDWLTHQGSVGQARKGRTLRIDDGVIWCEAPDFASFEYWNDPEKTAHAWRATDSGNEFSVGDLGRLDDDGFLYLEGRRSDLIITGGVNVYPAQVEAAILDHPGFSEAAVFGVDDEQWGQRVCAAIIGDADPAAVSDWLRDRVAAYQRPKRIYGVNDFPRTASGKIRRTELPSALGL